MGDLSIVINWYELVSWYKMLLVWKVSKAKSTNLLNLLLNSRISKWITFSWTKFFTYILFIRTDDEIIKFIKVWQSEELHYFEVESNLATLYNCGLYIGLSCSEKNPHLKLLTFITRHFWYQDCYKFFLFIFKVILN